jgi:transcriptional regulator with XRE-family HTH domain
MGNKRRKPQHLAAKLLVIRQTLGLSQIQLTQRLGFEDEAYHRVSEYETGRREPNLMVLLRYCEVAGLHAETIINDRIDPSRTFTPSCASLPLPANCDVSS